MFLVTAIRNRSRAVKPEIQCLFRLANGSEGHVQGMKSGISEDGLYIGLSALNM